MQKPISPTMHGVIDYTTVGATLAAPMVLDLPDRAKYAAWSLAGGYLALSALTDYKPAAKRAIPLKAHAAVDAGLGAAVPALPWLLGFAGNRKARNLFLGLTAITLAVTALTDWSSDD